MSLFSSTVPSQAPKSGPQQPVSNELTGSDKILKDLLELANNFPKRQSGLGSIQLTLPGLKSQTDSLRKAVKKTDGSDATHIRAHYLLAQSGISADEIENELSALQNESRYDLGTTSRIPSQHNTPKIGSSSLNVVEVVQLAPPQLAANLDSYLSVKKGENVLAAIELSLEGASKDFDAFVKNSVAIDWKTRKASLRKNHGIPLAKLLDQDGQNDKIQTNLSWLNDKQNHYQLLAPLSNSKPFISVSSKQLTREKFESHAQVIYELNESRLVDKFYPLCLNFELVSKATADLKSRQVGDVWKILVDLCDEKQSRVSQEQKFHTSYSLKDTGLQTLNEKIISTSKRHLETQFSEYIEQFYNRQDEESLGAATVEKLPPTTTNKVITFIKKVAKISPQNQGSIENTLTVNGVPIWAILFYLLRSGKHQEALQLVQENADWFNKLDTNFPLYLSKFVSNGVVTPVALNERLQQDFYQQFGFYVTDDTTENFDVYKYSVYKIIGKCDLSKKSLPRSINLSIEDWFWFHLSLVNEPSSNDPSTSASLGESQLIFENYPLADLQKQVIQLGPKKLNASSNSPFYLKALIMSGLFELAVQYTYEHINECDAVHLAIGLVYYGLLRVVDFANSPPHLQHDGLIEVNSKTGDFAVNFGRFLGLYTRTFKILDPKVAAHYSILIALGNGGNSPADLAICHEAIRELVLSTREFGLLLGEINPSSGEKVPGLFENRRKLFGLLKIEDYYHTIIDVSATRCEEEGRVFDSLLLYQLAQEYRTVVKLINKLLSEALSTSELDKPLIKPSTDTTSTNVILFSQHIIETFNKNAYILDELSQTEKIVCDKLLSIVKIREQFLSRDWRSTLTSIEKLELVPIGESDNLITIRQRAMEVLRTLDENLTRIIPSLLIIVMTCLPQLSYQLCQKYGDMKSQRDELDKIKGQAKNCMIYAGMVQYKMPRETYSLLVNLEALLQL